MQTTESNQISSMPKVITFKELDKLLWNWEMSNRNVIISMENKITFSHIFKYISCRIYHENIYIDCENGMYGALTIPIKNILSITQFQERVQLVFDNGVFLSLNTIDKEKSVEFYYRKAMYERWYGKEKSTKRKTPSESVKVKQMKNTTLH
jgi:hypothetical protein